MDVATTSYLKNLLVDAVKQQAADIHLSVGNAPIVRVFGQLKVLDTEPVVTVEFLQSVLETILSADQRAQLDTKRELVTTHDFDKQLRFKLNVFYQRDLPSMTLRYIPSVVPAISELSLSPTIAELSQLNKGLVIISGPFGSGRSTTAAALIEEINRTRKSYIITIEDPIEYQFSNRESIIEQRQVGRDTNSVMDALTYFQAEDGDVLFLDELQDPATIPLVLEIARGGSLVVTTMSADSASKTIARILDSFTSLDEKRVRDLLASSLQAVVCQKLLPRIGGDMIVVQEVLRKNDAVRSAISNGNIAQLENSLQTSRQEGMISFEQSLAELVKRHAVTLEAATDAANDPRQLENLLHS